MRTKKEYYTRTNPMIQGGNIKHYPSGTSILMDILIRTIKYNCIRFKRKK